MFFNKKKAKYNIVNDQDSEVFNLFQVLMNNKQELIDLFTMMPIHQDLWDYWKVNKEIDPVKRAVRFLFLSNFGYMGKPDTLRYLSGNAFNAILKDIELVHEIMLGVEFMNCDFRVMFDKISFKNNQHKESAFIYADPPYLESTDCYESHFVEKDSHDLFEVLQSTGIKWAMSEFDHPFIIGEAKKRKLNIITIGERVNMKNRRTEILVTNYKTHPSLFDAAFELEKLNEAV